MTDKTFHTRGFIDTLPLSVNVYPFFLEFFSEHRTLSLASLVGCLVGSVKPLA